MPRTLTSPGCGHAVPVPASDAICPNCGRSTPRTSGVEWVVWGWVGAALLVLCGLGVSSGPVCTTGGTSKRDEALLKAQNLHKAALAYQAKNDAYPPTLDVLVTDGEKPALVLGGQGAVTDPWGGRFQFEIVTARDGRQHPVVWTTAPDGTRIQWPRE